MDRSKFFMVCYYNKIQQIKPIVAIVYGKTVFLTYRNPDPNLRKRAAKLILNTRKMHNLQKPDCPQDLPQDYETMEENI